MFDREKAKIGDKVRLTESWQRAGDNLTEGQIVTYAGPCSNEDVDVTILDDTSGGLIHFIPTRILEPVTEEVEPVTITPENTSSDGGVPPIQATPEEMRDILQAQRNATEALRNQVAGLESQLSASRRATVSAIQKHESDMRKISERLCELADDENWCDEFDERLEEFSDTLNGTLTGRMKDFTVTVTFEQEITVRARNADSAIDEARESEDYGRCTSYDESDASAEED